MIVAFVPRSLLKRLLADRAAVWHANVVLSHAILLTAVSLCVLLLAADRWPHVCLVRQWTGRPCPGCGITTSLDRLARGDVGRSLAANPAGPLLFVGLVLHLLLHALALGRAERRPSCNRISQRVGAACWSVLLIVWLCRLFSNHL